MNKALHKPTKKNQKKSESYLEPEITRMVQFLGPEIDRKWPNCQNGSNLCLRFSGSSYIRVMIKGGAI